MNQIKLKRIGSQIVKEVSDILNNVARDRIMHTITITGCDVSNDLSYAKVYFTSAMDIDKKQIEKELEEASGYIRHELSERIEVGKINVDEQPEIAIKYDVMSIPTLILFKDGKVVNTIIGYHSKEEILDFINSRI